MWNSIRNSTNNGTKIFSRLKKKMQQRLENLRIGIHKNSRTIDKRWKKNFLWLSNSLQSYWINRRSKLISRNRRIIQKHMLFKLGVSKWKWTRGRSTWLQGTRRLWPQKLNWSKSNKMKWMRWRRNLRQIWMKDWSSEKPNTTNFFKDTRMSRKKLKSSKIWNKLSLKRQCFHMLAKPKIRWTNHGRVPRHREAWWGPECNLKWARVKKASVQAKWNRLLSLLMNEMATLIEFRSKPDTSSKRL